MFGTGVKKNAPKRGWQRDYLNEEKNIYLLAYKETVNNKMTYESSIVKGVEQ